MQTQFSVLGYTTDLFFHDYKLTIETDENDHSDRNINYEVKIQKRIEQKLGCKFIRLIFRHIKQLFNNWLKKP